MTKIDLTDCDDDEVIRKACSYEATATLREASSARMRAAGVCVGLPGYAVEWPENIKQISEHLQYAERMMQVSRCLAGWQEHPDLLPFCANVCLSEPGTSAAQQADREAHAAYYRRSWKDPEPTDESRYPFVRVIAIALDRLGIPVHPKWRE